MKQFSAFMKKELTEQFRTYKILIPVLLCLLSGIASPILAKLTPELLKYVNTQGITIEIKDATIIDSYAQFFKNTTGLVMIVIMLMFCFSLTNEITKGTLVNMLSKGLSRKVVVFAKYFSAVIIWTIGYAASVISLIITTYLLFGEIEVNYLFVSLFGVWMFGIFILAVIQFAGSLINGNLGAILGTAAITVVLYILDIIPSIQRFNPITLINNNMSLIDGSFSESYFLSANIVAIIGSVIFILLAVVKINKKRI